MLKDSMGTERRFKVYIDYKLKIYDYITNDKTNKPYNSEFLDILLRLNIRFII